MRLSWRAKGFVRVTSVHLGTSMSVMPLLHISRVFMVVNQHRREVHPSRVDREALSGCRRWWRFACSLVCVPCLPCAPLRSTVSQFAWISISLNLGTSTARASILDSLREDITIMFSKILETLAKGLSTAIEECFGLVSFSMLSRRLSQSLSTVVY